MASKYGVELISGIAPKNGGNFPLVHAKDVEMKDGSRLSELVIPTPDPCTLPTVSESDNGKILQVSGGKWQAAEIAGSAVAGYIDAYIAEALGGDY